VQRLPSPIRTPPPAKGELQGQDGTHAFAFCLVISVSVHTAPAFRLPNNTSVESLSVSLIERSSSEL
jgi:hypothetical protein